MNIHPTSTALTLERAVAMIEEHQKWKRSFFGWSNGDKKLVMLDAGELKCFEFVGIYNPPLYIPTEEKFAKFLETP